MKTQQHIENLNTRFLSGVSRENTHRDDTKIKPHPADVNKFWQLVLSDKNINKTQYFSNFQEVSLNFFLGVYLPAQKWLKDRKDRELSFDNILHYEKINVALTMKDR